MFNLLDTRWTWGEVDRWWKSQDIISHMYDWRKECITFFKTDKTFLIDVALDQFYIVKLDIYLQNLGDETELTRVWTAPGGSC